MTSPDPTAGGSSAGLPDHDPSTTRRRPSTATPLDVETVRRRVAESRAAQGLPPTIQDPAVLSNVAQIFRLAAAAKAAS